MVVRRQRPGASLPDRAGRKSLLRAAAPVGAGLVALRSAGPGDRPHAEGRPNHRHRQQRGLSSAWSVVSVVYRSCARPRGWRIRRANQPGAWMDPIVELLKALAPAVPQEMTVIVLCDRGLASPKLWQQIMAQGWHPYMRYPKSITFCADGGRRLPARAFVSRPDTAPVRIPRGSADAPPLAPPPPNAVAPCWRSGTPSSRNHGSSSPTFRRKQSG